MTFESIPHHHLRRMRSWLHRALLNTPAFVIMLSITSPEAAQPLYKWIDETGQIRYSDHLPAERKKKAHQTLSPEGHILETRKDAIPPEELARMREEKKRQEEEAIRQAKEAARIQAIKDHHDNVLLMTFTDEEEIIEAQNERVSVIVSVIQLLRKNIANEQEKLKKLEQRAQEKYIDRDQRVPGGLAQNIEYFQEKILGIQQQLALKLEERERVKRQYVEDLLRYRQLTLNKEKKDPPRP